MKSCGAVKVALLDLTARAGRWAVKGEFAVPRGDEFLEISVHFWTCGIAVAVVHVHRNEEVVGR